MTALDTYLQTQWSSHATAPFQVADGLECGFALLKAGEAQMARLPELAKLIEHTLLAHCGDAARARRWARRLRALGAPNREAQAALQRLEFALAVAHGLHPRPPPLADEQVLSGCVNGLVACCAREGAATPLHWIARLRSELDSASRSRLKAVAGAMNGLSFHLCRLSDTEDARAVMAAAALLSRDARARAGQWRRLSQAERFLALTWVQLGNGVEALAAALRCEALCIQHQALPEERLLAADAIARGAALLGEAPTVQRSLAHMQALLSQVADPAVRQQCAAVCLQTAASVGCAPAEPVAGAAAMRASTPGGST